MAAQKNLLDAVAHLARRLSDHALEQLCEKLELLPSGTPEDDILQSLEALVDIKARSEATRLLAIWRTEARNISAESLALMLRAASNADKWRNQEQQVETVWTGPVCIENLRRTDAALMEVIDAARERLWIVTFAAYNVKPVMQALKRAAARGVAVNFIGESSTENEALTSGGVNSLRQHLPGKVKIYIWPLENRMKNESGKHGALHAKMAIADGKIALVSSANLSGHALLLNIEAGILVYGGNVPVTFENQLEAMIAGGIIQCVS